MANDPFPEKLWLDQLRSKYRTVVRLADPTQARVVEVQDGQFAGCLALAFPASGAVDGYCVLVSDRQSLLELAQVIQSYFGESFEDKILAKLERIERLLEQRKNS